jgi:ABC-2 type transport system ATP-binding protein
MSIQFRNLTKTYRAGAEAVRNLTFDIAPGTVFALMGRNGAGKTTSIHCLLDLLIPTSGEALIFGVPAPKLQPEHRQRIGYVSENQKLPDWMKVEEFLRFLKPMYPGWDDALTEKFVKLFALPMHQRLDRLSRGQRMKAAFLGALCYRPEVLILDEPFSGLDSVMRQDLLDALVEFLGEGDRTVLLSSHDLEEVERLADTIGVLNHGRLGLHGNINDLLSSAREVSFLTNAPALPAGLSLDWWNPTCSAHGVTFTAVGVSDESALTAQIQALWQDADRLLVRPPGLQRFYTDFLRHTSTPAPDSSKSPAALPL